MTVDLVLLSALVFLWETIQTDYTNAFAQATLAEEVYMELPHDFSPPDESAEFVLKLNKSLYGLHQAPFLASHTWKDIWKPEDFKQVCI